MGRLPLHRFLLLQLFLLIAVSPRVPAAAARDACAAVPFNTLTLDCSAACPLQGASCVVYDATQFSPCDYEGASAKSSCVSVASASSSSGCTYQCFEPYTRIAHRFKFYIAFNATRTTKPPSATNEPTASATLQDFPDDTPFESNALVRRIGELALPASIDTVVLSGGRSGSGSRGSVVDLDIDPSIFQKAPQLTSISLLNMDLGGRVADVAALLPSNTIALDLTNTNLTTVPPLLSSLTQLQSLTLSQNELREFPSSATTLPLLKTLLLSENSLTSFTANFPELESLDLSKNQLETFPFAVLTLTSLRTLKVDGNPTLTGVVFSASQFANLSALESFSIDAEALDRSSCVASQVQTLPHHNQSVCVLSDAEWESYSRSKLQLTDTSDASSSSDRSTAAMVTVVAAIIVALGIAGGCYLRRRKRRQATDKGNQRSGATQNTGDIEDTEYAELVEVASVHGSSHGDSVSDMTASGTAHPTWTLQTDEQLQSHRLKVDDIQDIRIIGRGGFAVVWLTKHAPRNRLLASKRLIKDLVARKKTLEFVAEIKLNMQFVHPSIVEFVGVAWTIETDLQALLEYMPNGDLLSYLDASSEATASRAWSLDKLRIAIDIVEALVYVHSFSPPLVHRDLKSRNVLLGDNLKAKLGDFGVSRFESENGTMTASVGTGRWLAPEVIAGSASYDTSCDIYAFGVILSELDTHKLPYEDVNGRQGNKLPEVAVLQMVARGVLQPTLSDSCPAEIKLLAQQCMAFDAASRPSAIGVAYALRRLRNDWARREAVVEKE